MTAEKIAHFSQMLHKEKKRIELDRDRYIRDDQSDTEDDAPSELSHNDGNNPADEATNLFDRERDGAATDNMNRILAKIDRALAKIQDGTYGLSDIDGTPIPVARLEALPYALTTVDQDDTI